MSLHPDRNGFMIKYKYSMHTHPTDTVVAMVTVWPRRAFSALGKKIKHNLTLFYQRHRDKYFKVNI